ncbi:MAG: hypothetical protein KatS3mg108_1709 [Isosphaeraceae bacterium]|jgi:pilus assembly protein CpaC|nr:MAG: hypothetical protein KatS3mg108_1709 [Isosphaeraceae bacterium]
MIAVVLAGWISGSVQGQDTELPALPLEAASADPPAPSSGGPPVPSPPGRVLLEAPSVAGLGEALLEVAGEAAAEVHVAVGRSKIFEVKRPLERIFLANPAIANVRFLDQESASPKLLDIYGLSFGNTTLTLWEENGPATSIRIRVGIDTKDLEGRLARVFPGADVRVSQIGSQVILEGQVPDAKTMSEVLQIVQATLVGEAASIPLQSGRQVALRRDEVIRAGFQVPEGAEVQEGVVAPPAVQPAEPAITPEFPDTQPVVPGPGAAIPSSATQRTTFLTVSPRAGGGLLPPATIVNRVHVPGPRQVLLKVKIAELNRTALREFGANAQWIVGDNVINSVVGGIGAAQSQLFGVFDSGRFTVFLNALRNNQLARILAEPNLVALDGQPARFLAGGSFPFPVPQAGINGANVITIEFRDFGAILQFIPHIIADDTIRLDVEPSFSELNFGAGTSVNGTTVPGINQRSARTVVELREGQTLAIAGLLSTRTNGSTQRIPLIGDAPVIGPLFSRNRVETTETELVVLVTPELVDAMEPEQVPPGPGDLYLEPNDAEFFMLGRIEGRTGKPFRSTIHELDPFGMMRHVQSEQNWVVGPHGYAD